MHIPLPNDRSHVCQGLMPLNSQTTSMEPSNSSIILLLASLANFCSLISSAEQVLTNVVILTTMGKWTSAATKSLTDSRNNAFLSLSSYKNVSKASNRSANHPCAHLFGSRNTVAVFQLSTSLYWMQTSVKSIYFNTPVWRNRLQGPCMARGVKRHQT